MNDAFFPLLAALVLLVGVICVLAGCAVWSARRQRERIAEAVEDWCKDYVDALEKRTKEKL